MSRHDDLACNARAGYARVGPADSVRSGSGRASAGRAVAGRVRSFGNLRKDVRKKLLERPKVLYRQGNFS